MTNCNLSGLKQSSLSAELKGILKMQKDLQCLFLSGNLLQKFPSELSEFTGLTHLDMSFNQIEAAEFGSDNFKELLYLDLRSNKITSLPEDLYLFRSLECLLLNCNNLSKINKLPSSLATLDISRNFLTSLPVDFFKHLNNLKNINLSFNLLTNLPLVIGLNLTTLNCSNNKLVEFPNISQSTELKFLDLSSNSIRLMPEDCFDFQHNLIKILLNCNPISNLPDLSDLMSLTTLDISNTDVVKLPPSLASLAHLKTLYLVPVFKSISNPRDPGRKSDFEKFIYPPAEIVFKGLPAIQKYLQNVNEDEKKSSSEALNENVKISVLKKGHFEELDCLLQELVFSLSEMNLDQTEAVYSLVMTSIHDLLRPHILYVFLNSGLKGGSPILGKFIIRVERIMSRFERNILKKYYKSVISKIFELVEAHLFNSMLMKRDFANEKTLNLISDVIGVWSLFGWEHYSIQTMTFVQDLVLIGKAISLNTSLKAQTNLSKRQVGKWLSLYENDHEDLLHLEFLNGSKELFKVL